MGWGEPTSSRSPRIGTGGFQTPPANDLPKDPPKPYSYMDTSPGYVEVVVSAAWKKLVQLTDELSGETDLSLLFVENPSTELERRAQAYFRNLGTNEQAAIREFHARKGSKVGRF